MTTREEFALQFAVTSYGTVLRKLLDTPGDPPQAEDLQRCYRSAVQYSVEMADLLIDELAKDKSPS